ncbi:MAG: hypothetical protein LH473_02680 [Chitinophagales bacterium]|nr:hypothetical protein [Chitinophagales bacterium]
MKTEEILIEVEPQRKKELLNILGKIDFIKILTKESLLDDFIITAPENVQITEEELDTIVFEERYAGRKK